LLLLLLLLLLLHSLYFSPHQISRFSQHGDRVALLRSLEFEHVLHLPDALKCTRQSLRGAQLLLLLLLTASLLLASPLLLTASLLLATFRHTTSCLTLSPALAWRLRPRRTIFCFLPIPDPPKN
jgi:hypothetical protein